LRLQPEQIVLVTSHRSTILHYNKQKIQRKSKQIRVQGWRISKNFKGFFAFMKNILLHIDKREALIEAGGYRGSKKVKSKFSL
jgi:hypothetical protein